MHRRVRDIEITRGDSFDIWVGLARGWTQIADDPEAYEGRLVLRERHDDDMPEVLVMTSSILPGEDSRFPEMSNLLHFEASPAQTQALPDWNMVCFCEVRTPDQTWVQRLFDGKVTIRD